MLAAVWCLVLAGLAATAGTASAYHDYFCGFLIPSTSTSPPGFSCYGTRTALTYASASYGGAGLISELRAAIVDTSHFPYNGTYGRATNATFVSYCHGSQAVANVAGADGQTDGGANHTINGYEDDSPNHTGCQYP